jgi:acyl-CoA dehydrogenase
MHFDLTPKALAIQKRVWAFYCDHILPKHQEWTLNRWTSEGIPVFFEGLRQMARDQGLWNLALPLLAPDEPGTRLSNLEFAGVAEILGRLPWASQVFNCQAPDVPNMAMLQALATPEQKQRWLIPSLNGKMRSAFAMTEPRVASSDASNIETRIDFLDDRIRINGRKWFATGAAHPDCAFLIVMGVSDPDNKRTSRQSMVIVPMGTPGLTIVRELSFMGWRDHVAPIAELDFHDVEVPLEHLLGQRGQGFSGAQVRLGPARIHHCMRCIGMAEMLLEHMQVRARERATFGRLVIDYDTIQNWIAQGRVDIEQARLLIQRTAWKLDNRPEIQTRRDMSLIKVAVPTMLQRIADQSLQLFGAMGGTEDTLIHHAHSYARWFRIGDGPDEVHLRQIFRSEPIPEWGIANSPYITHGVAL